jgi:hypothetical protein
LPAEPGRLFSAKQPQPFAAIDRNRLTCANLQGKGLAPEETTQKRH